MIPEKSENRRAPGILREMEVCEVVLRPPGEPILHTLRCSKESDGEWRIPLPDDFRTNAGVVEPGPKDDTYGNRLEVIVLLAERRIYPISSAAYACCIADMCRFGRADLARRMHSAASHTYWASYPWTTRDVCVMELHRAIDGKCPEHARWLFSTYEERLMKYEDEWSARLVRAGDEYAVFDESAFLK